MTTIVYAYPIINFVSFKWVAREYINLLKGCVRVYEFDVDSLARFNPVSKPNLIAHPFFYPFISRPEAERIVFKWRRNQYNKIIGVDVADTNRISERAVELANKADGLIVNSEWSKEAFVKSGVKVPVYVVPHTLPEPFFKDTVEPKSDIIKKLIEFRRSHPNVAFGLFFLWHSGYRKGADLAAEIVERLVKRGKKLILIVKIVNILDPLLGRLEKLPSVVIKGWLSEEDLVALYDLVDFVLSPSRGGSFELNSVEAWARGKYVVAPRGGPFLEHVPPHLHSRLLASVRAWVKPLPDNPIHVGTGPEIDTAEAADMLEDYLENRDLYKPMLEEVKRYVREKYSRERVRHLLIDALSKLLGVDLCPSQRITERHLSSVMPTTRRRY